MARWPDGPMARMYNTALDVTALYAVMGRIFFCFFVGKKGCMYMYSHDICEEAAIDSFNQAPVTD